MANPKKLRLLSRIVRNLPPDFFTRFENRQQDYDLPDVDVLPVPEPRKTKQISEPKGIAELNDRIQQLEKKIDELSNRRCVRVVERDEDGFITKVIDTYPDEEE